MAPKLYQSRPDDKCPEATRLVIGHPLNSILARMTDDPGQCMSWPSQDDPSQKAGRDARCIGFFVPFCPRVVGRNGCEKKTVIKVFL
jgi:hypothetical protein